MVSMAMLLWAGCGESGPTTLQNRGSETMVEMMSKMAAEYQKTDPTIVVNVAGGGSETGIQALIQGTVQLANASRPLTEEEKAAAKAQKFTPFETIIAYDGLAVVVNKENPIASITFDELRCIYSASGTCGKWSDVGVTLDCGGNDTITKHGREATSGTEEYFREVVLGFNGQFTSTTNHPRPEALMQAVGGDKCAIGFVGMGNHAEGVKVVCLSQDRGHDCAEPSVETVKSGKYVFSRPLFVYTRAEPAGAMKKYIDWLTSEPGQKIAAESGFVPLR